MPKINAVIFDRDGVLTYFLFKKGIDAVARYVPGFTLEEGMRVWGALGKSHGFPKNPEEEILFFDQFWQALAQHYTLDPERQTALQQLNYMEFIEVFPDTLPALALCKQKNMKVGVLSNFPLASLQESLQRFKLDAYIDEAISASVIGTRKPEPEAYLALCRKLSVDPGECVFFDDEQPCVSGASAVGMTAYQVDREQEKHDLDNRIIANLEALELIIK
ncbi:hypothetical protein DIZ81_11390 [Legionella taurinensis]|uniref:HAD family hydrolase n=1 Tax=Legionella taurinensis TaxID=70611 RepID=A0A3A5L2B5_9GAMM|nr:HAD-IA family hydrolase [Legionella taurinensis]MDX1838562.1 HAD-IA family hydrolase [Legionella taurinensis]PUT39008.1 hypothetical protein DB744_11400 [Legionella taurinensis]PUT41095.1 hypothetical protein DB746_09790 [Legionella taurinensis]PUT43470.1 hypothetical protein DB743_10795 [Legionella taurinensis]PUT46487.1 hypothetical protein DB745_10280 [Legionella taurinensis]